MISQNEHIFTKNQCGILLSVCLVVLRAGAALWLLAYFTDVSFPFKRLGENFSETVSLLWWAGQSDSLPVKLTKSWALQISSPSGRESPGQVRWPWSSCNAKQPVMNLLGKWWWEWRVKPHLWILNHQAWYFGPYKGTMEWKAHTASISVWSVMAYTWPVVWQTTACMRKTETWITNLDTLS